jgi:hypothetical protein
VCSVVAGDNLMPGRRRVGHTVPELRGVHMVPWQWATAILDLPCRSRFHLNLRQPVGEAAARGVPRTTAGRRSSFGNYVPSAGS